MFSEHWELWQDCVVEAVDKHFQPLGEKALTDNRYCYYIFTFLSIDLFKAL